MMLFRLIEYTEHRPRYTVDFLYNSCGSIMLKSWFLRSLLALLVQTKNSSWQNNKICPGKSGVFLKKT